MTAVDERPGARLDLDAIKNLGIKDPERLVAFLEDFKKAEDERNTNLREEVAEQAATTVLNMLRENGVKNRVPQGDEKVTAGRTRTARGCLYNKRAPGAVLDGKATDYAEFFQSQWHNVGNLRDSENLVAKREDWKRLQNSFSSTVPDAGGALIPEEFRSEILANSLEEGVVRSRATVIPMSTQRLSIPAVDETTHSTSVFGGIVAYWTEEGAAATESQASFGKVSLEPSKLTLYCEAPNELVADAPAFNGFLDMVLPKACAFEEDYKFLVGSGVGEPEGALSGTGVISVSRTTASKIKANDIVNMYSRMLPSSIQTAVWLVSPDAIPQLLTLVMPTGDATTTFVAPPLFLANQSIAGPMLGTLLGRPVIVTEKVSALGTAGDLAFVDFTQYLIGDRMAMTLTSSPHFKFSTDKTAYKLVERVDGRGWVRSAITPKNGSSNTLSPYVKLS